MAPSMARVGRRRRVLNDEVLHGSGASAAAQAAAFDPDAPRYGEQANIENHPQVTDFVPRRKVAVFTTLLAGVGAAAATAAIAHYSETIAAALPGVSASELSAGMAGGVSAWTTAVAMLMIAMLAKLTFSLRRHRVDDYAGRYRVWKWVGWGALAMSVNAVAPIHGLLAKAAMTATGWSLTAAGAEWWLAPLALVGGWIFVRLLLEIGESRPAMAFTLTAAACYVAAAVGVLGFLPATAEPWGGMAANALPLVGATFALTGMMVFARYVVLDVQGLIDHAPRPVVEKPTKVAKVDAAAEVKAASPVAITAKAAPAQTPAGSSTATRDAEEAHDPEWSDDAEEDDDFGNRKLSKADKKRLRRQHRAA
ncbi:hypothetical protein I41_32840 [Lacipirellula limnantheis]|uniref:Uncharacterized protein n=1 Tax=Lacipirellula limnantheis TaxID=2528024 RepID=A0A517U0E1_9BACT|nr:hypothetical protein I41_32840 [Lacipirellula limnantheis]